MTSLTDLREVVDVVIGVDTHIHTHSAAVVDAATGGVRARSPLTARAEGYAELVELAGEHATLRAWAIEGTGGHGAGLSRHLLDLAEIVVELDRPKRAPRRNGAKSDPLDAISAAREALARTRLGTPRSPHPECRHLPALTRNRPGPAPPSCCSPSPPWASADPCSPLPPSSSRRRRS